MGRKIMKKTRGDVIRINITPPSDTFPWVRIFLHKYGIKKPGRSVSDNVGANKGKSRKKVACEIGEEIISNSKVLSAWFKDRK